jgi:outer membrane autotransporter protein
LPGRFNVLLGASFSYADGDSQADDRADRWRHELYTVAAYGSARLAHRLQLDAILSAGISRYETRRQVIASTGENDVARAAPDGSHYGVRARLSRTYERSLLGRSAHVTPHLGVNFTRVKVEGYQETGPGAVAVDNFSHEALALDAGVEMQGQHETRWGVVRPSLILNVEHASLDDNEVTRVRPPLGGGFDQTIPALDNWTGVLGLGASLIDDENGTAVRIGYEGRFGDELTAHTLAVRGRMRF